MGPDVNMGASWITEPFQQRNWLTIIGYVSK
jgi:hypothetical protein